MTFSPFSATPEENPSENLLHFTNRVMEKAAYHRLLALSTGDALPVLMFYGVGGTGKTWLAKKLQRDESGNLPTAYITLDPNAGGTNSIDSAKRLINIRMQLGEKIFCPHFDLAYAWLRHKEKGGDKPSFKGAGLLGNVWELLVEAASYAAKDIPWSNFISLFVRKVTSPITTQISKLPWKDWLLSKIGQDDFVSLKNRSADEIYQELTNRLLRDLNENLPVSEGQRARAVLFIDSMESLRTPHDSETQIHDSQKWVKELYHEKSSLLLVLTGRDRLIWGDQQGAIFAEEKHLEQHLVGGLSEHDAREFLTKCGIEDIALQDAILKVSEDREIANDGGEIGYHAFSLGLCADMIFKSQQDGKQVDPATFDMAPGDTLKLAEKFLKSLGTDSAYELWLKKLALPPRFDERAARSALGGEPGEVQNAAWKALLSYSFVQPATEPGWYKLHAKMRDALEEITQNSSQREENHRWWQQEWESRSTTDCDNFAALSWYHQWSLEPEAALEEWVSLAKRERAALHMQQHANLLTWWEPIQLDNFPTDIEIRTLKANALIYLGNELQDATIGDRAENLTKAINCYEAALTVRTEKDFPQNWALTKNNLGNVYLFLPGGDRAENLTKAINCYEEALTVRTEKDFRQDWAMTKNNLGLAYGNLPGGDRAENLTKAINCYEAAFTVRTEKDFPQDWAMTKNNLGAAYADLPGGDRAENLTKAINCYEEALTVRTEKGFPQGWAATQNNLGEAYQKQARLEQVPGEPCHAGWRKAESYFQNALSGFESCGHEHYAAEVRQNLEALREEMPEDC